MIDLYIRDSGDDFIKVRQRFYSYASALLEGSKLVGYGNFYIETHNRVPTREELLGESHPKSKKQKILDQL